ncbi:WD40/YVTN/BNR-like repeat-containing protein [Halorussus caseinilyticus]|uniref:WD40/YVTN/BNR-like repeat-containing protein n=1 Tax=Halorussus caseinilyticus TaxID=3034025 RepID=UPI0023E849B9|nr:hypothetical protein [Halorussus sp. DT72]
MSERTRRSALKVMGSTIALAAVPGTVNAASGWASASSPVQTTLHDVEYADTGAYAVGGGGDVVERTSNGWQKILDGGASGGGNDLLGSDVTDDGERLWFVGKSGEVGEYDVSTGSLTDRSNPLDSGNNFSDVAVTGNAGSANVFATDQSGKIFYNFDNGTAGKWHSVTPGSGAALPAIDFFDLKDGHAIDTNQKVFETTDGASWQAIGNNDAGVTFYGVDSDGFDDVWVCGGNGTVFHYDGANWTPTGLGNPALRDIEVTTDDGDGYAVGDGGAVFDLTSGTWSQDDTPTGANLKGVVRGSTDIAVGAGGTIIEN